MVDTTFINKINLIYDFLKNNSLIFLALLLVIVIILDLLYGKNTKQTKILYICVIFLIILYVLFSYYKPFLNIIDVYITNIFRLSYFPSIIEYFSMVLITIIVQFVSIKKFNKVLKNINIWIGIILEILFILNIIAMNGISVDLNSITSIYENDLLLSIFQLSGIIFMIWMIFNIITFIVMLYLSDRIEMPCLKDDYYE